MACALRFGGLALAASLGWAGPAGATQFTAAALANDQAILSQFNLVNFGTYTTSNETEGRIVVGGNFNANAQHNACFNGCSGNAAIPIGGAGYGAVTVFGNVTGGFSVGSAGSSNTTAFIGGSASGTLNFGHKGSLALVGPAAGAQINDPVSVVTSQSEAGFGGQVQNAGSVAYGQPSATVFPFGPTIDAAFRTPLTQLAAGLATLASAPGAAPQALPNPPGGNLSFTAGHALARHGKTYGIVTTTLQELASERNFFGINNNGNDATIVIVLGTGSYILPNLNGNNDESRVIWDFVDATTLVFGGGWYGTILAPHADILAANGDLTGTVVANSLNQTNELHARDIFRGDLSGLDGLRFDTAITPVPEPASLAVLGLGLAGLATARRHRRARAAGGGRPASLH